MREHAAEWGGMKKDRQLKVNLPAPALKKAGQVDAEIGLSPSGLARVLLEAFLDARERYKHLAWPLRFAYYDADPAGAVIRREHGAGTG
ncbi:MAG: hypothetical protein BWY59_00092 [Verrucomicrobia bacterium ADurb.Bin345]|nr:MAG: hypothetical protein BWY59_00092 [Verrucomicrobia bacterium ADurb.Bin345]